MSGRVAGVGGLVGRGGGKKFGRKIIGRKILEIFGRKFFGRKILKILRFQKSVEKCAQF